MKVTATIRICISIIICLAFSGQVIAEVRVKNTITGPDPIRETCRKAFEKALHIYKDVRITDDHPDWIIKIIAVKDTSTRGRDLGVTLSILVLEAAYIKVEDCRFLKYYNGPLYVSYDHGLKKGSPDSLDKMCADLVTTLDTRFFALTRRYNLARERLK